MGLLDWLFGAKRSPDVEDLLANGAPLTSEEQPYVDSVIADLKRELGPDALVQKEMLNMLIAFGLSQYFQALMQELGLRMAQGRLSDSDGHSIMGKATVAACKAYYVSKLPFFLYRAATGIEDEAPEKAKFLCRRFLAEQRSSNLSSAQKFLLDHLNIDVELVEQRARTMIG